MIPIHVPPLRERLSDLPQLVEHFIAKFSEEHQTHCAPLGADDTAWLAKYHWPGNVPELRNVIERFVIRGELGPIQSGPLPGVRARSVVPAVECRA